MSVRERDRRLPSEPLRERLRVFAAEHPNSIYTQHELQIYGLVGPVTCLETMTGVSGRTIRMILNGRNPSVLESTADKILTALGEPLSLVYG